MLKSTSQVSVHKNMKTHETYKQRGYGKFCMEGKANVYFIYEYNCQRENIKLFFLPMEDVTIVF